MRAATLLLCTVCLLPMGHALGVTLPSHELSVRLRPEAGELEATDRIRLPAAQERLEFALHEALQATSDSGRLEREGAVPGLPWRRWRLTLPAAGAEATVNFRGRLSAPPGDPGALNATPGHIGPEGVFLSGGSGWYPALAGEERFTFSLRVELPQGWGAVSQGAATAQGWEERQPQEEITLVANRFHRGQRATPFGEAQVWLLKDEPALAERYLAATERYLTLYSGLLGRYPYAKFALVENFWESGYGMPSYTLLGGKVLRLPFILQSAYPHEVVHNWWGNGVFVDYPSGNWSEGLTAYIADHLLAEQAGRGEAYRRDLLKKYTEYAAKAQVLPLAAFRSRHSEASQAVGYGKGAMVFHMLRLALGEERFKGALRALFEEKRFENASWADLRARFAAQAGSDLTPFFDQWVERAGAPALALTEARAEAGAGGQRVRFTLAQTQPGAPYRLQVPVAVALADGRVQESSVELTGSRQVFELALPAAPTHLLVDPRFDLFRRLDPAELPPSLDGLFARGGRPLFLLPAGAPEELREAYRGFAEAFGQGRGEVRLDGEVDAQDLPGLARQRPVWLLGWENRLRPPLLEEGGSVAVAGERLPRSEASLVFVAQGLGVIATARPQALPGLARKLPHYGKYGQLLFAGDAPENVAKGEWPAPASPLTAALVTDAGPAPLLAPRAPLLP